VDVIELPRGSAVAAWGVRTDAGLTGLAAHVVEPNTLSLAWSAPGEDGAERGEIIDALVAELHEWARARGYRTLLLVPDGLPATVVGRCRDQGYRDVTASAVPAFVGRAALAGSVLRHDLAGVVALREPDPTWAAQFERERARIAHALDGAAIAVEHTGSTSVPGLAAKPIIDITLTVADSTDEAAYVAALEEVGYTFTLREPEWHEHRLLNRDWPRVNLHVFTDGCPEVAQMTGFRDWLRSHPEDRVRYEQVKRELAAREWAIVQDYADAKTDVVAEIKRRAGLLPD
jgi:GrpB-like predicted nucleotidyltransferase (UPF0157 family)